MTGTNDSSSSAEVSSDVHPSDRTCGCLSFNGPMAVYRNFRGEGEFFTGMLAFDARCETVWKLNDPNYLFEADTQPEDLEGHEMDTMEYLLDMGQYEPDPQKRQVKNVKDLTNILKDFKEKPSAEEFAISPIDSERFNTMYPHGKTSRVGVWNIPQVRKGDNVKICAVKYIEFFGRQASERLWVHVEAATTTGMVVGTILNTVGNPNLCFKQVPDDMTTDEDYHVYAGDLVSFPATCVYGVEHGENWA